MKKVVTILILVVLLLGVLVLAFVLNNADHAPEDTSAAASSCSKLGINYAVTGPVSETFHQRAASHFMGWELEIATNPVQATEIATSFKNAIANGLTPILRVCSGNECAFDDPMTYITFLQSISDELGPDRTFFAIAGPYEPLHENWLGGDLGNTDQTGPLVADYMNTLIDGLQSDNIKLLSPVFNPLNPKLEQFVRSLNDADARFNDLDGIAVNAYNLTGYYLDSKPLSKLSDQIKRIRDAGFTGYNIYLTEIGKYDSEKNTSWQGEKVTDKIALENLKAEIDKLKADNKIKAYLLFDSFSTNPDQKFSYNFLNDLELEYIRGEECNKSVITQVSKPIPTSSENNPCGQADANGDGKFTDVDFDAFVEVYGTKCTVLTMAESGTKCGSRDVNGDGKINVLDFDSFSKRFGKPGCELNKV